MTTPAFPFKEQAVAERDRLERADGLVDYASRCIDIEATAQRAVYAAEDGLRAVERAIKRIEAEADLMTADGKNATARESAAQLWLSEHAEYQRLSVEREEKRSASRGLAVDLATASHMRQLAMEALRLEAARLHGGAN